MGYTMRWAGYFPDDPTISRQKRPGTRAWPFWCLTPAFVTAATTATTAAATSAAATTTTATATGTTTAAASTISAATATAAAGFGHWTSFVDYQRATHHFFPIAGFHSAIRFRVIPNFGKAEATGLIGKLIADKGNYIDIYTLLVEPIRYVRLADAIRQVAKV